MSKRSKEFLRKWNERYHPERLKEKPKKDEQSEQKQESQKQPPKNQNFG